MTALAWNLASAAASWGRVRNADRNACLPGDRPAPCGRSWGEREREPRVIGSRGQSWLCRAELAGWREGMVLVQVPRTLTFLTKFL